MPKEGSNGFYRAYADRWYLDRANRDTYLERLAAGDIGVSGNLGLPNNKAVQIKDSGGTLFSLLTLNTNDHTFLHVKEGKVIYLARDKGTVEVSFFGGTVAGVKTSYWDSMAALVGTPLVDSPIIFMRNGTWDTTLAANRFLGAEIKTVAVTSGTLAQQAGYLALGYGIFNTDNFAGISGLLKLVQQAGPLYHVEIGRNDSGLVNAAVNDMLRLTAGMGDTNVSANFGFGLPVYLSNNAHEVEERISLDFSVVNVINGGEWAAIDFNIQAAGTLARRLRLAGDYMEATEPLYFTGSDDLASTADYVMLGGYEISPGHRALVISSEEAVVVGVAVASTHKYPVRINGVTYNLLLSNV
jgi:hypothetical protein